MQLIRATAADLPRLMEFYAHVTEHTPNMAETAKWVMGIHPREADVSAYIQKGGMYYSTEGESIVGAFAMGDGALEDYRGIPWLSPLPEEKAAVLHMLAVDPDRQGRGLGHALVLAAAEQARSLGFLSLRLDTFVCNTPGRRAYNAAGMTMVGEKPLYTENAGWVPSYFYELPLK